MADVKPTIQFDEFEKIDIRVGTILSVEDVTGSDKLVNTTGIARSFLLRYRLLV